MSFNILNRWTHAVVYASATADNLSQALLEALKAGANLRDADLRDADLRGANLTDANLTYANLTDADLRDADLTAVRDDFWAVLCSAPKEVFGLRLALIEGRVDGSAYQGECACLVATLANVRHCAYDAIPGLTPNSDRPAERFFLAIRKGDTPETSQPAKIALNWIDEWIENMRSAFTRVGR